MTRFRVAGRLVVAMAFAAPVAACPLHAQAGEWAVGRDAFAELWFHALAGVTPAADAPVALYSADYLRRVAVDRRRRGMASRLDSVRPALRDAMRPGGALEALHFVPMYFVGESPPAVLRALRAAFVSPHAARADPLTRRAAVIARALASARERAAAVQFIDAVEDDWRAMQRSAWSFPGPDAGAVDRLREAWLRELEPALRPYLHGVEIRRGRIVVVPSLGLDGRVLRAADGAALVMVGTAGAAETDRAPLLMAVRELTYPLIQRLPPRLLTAGPGARGAAERVRGAAAVRAGALLLDACAPTTAPAYRRLFAGSDAHGDPRAFDALYAASAELDAALQSEVARLGRPRGGTP